MVTDLKDDLEQTRNSIQRLQQEVLLLMVKVSSSHGLQFLP